MGREQETHVGDGSLIMMDQDGRCFTKKHNCSRKQLYFSRRQGFQVLFASVALPRHVYVTFGGTQPCVKCTQGLAIYLARACPITTMDRTCVHPVQHLGSNLSYVSAAPWIELVLHQCSTLARNFCCIF